MIGCLRAGVRKQPIIALYFESENELKFYNLKASCKLLKGMATLKTKVSLTLKPLLNHAICHKQIKIGYKNKILTSLKPMKAAILNI